MNPIRVACVRYLNTAPLVWGLDKIPEIQLVPTVPAGIATMVRDGRADVGLVSLVDAAEESGPALTLIPAGMIGCDGPTMTVRLFSALPPDRIRTVHADTDSRTSVVLCRVLLAEVFGVRPSIAAFDTRERAERPHVDRTPTPGADDPDATWPETVLLIGDKVVNDAPPADRYPHQLDLGQVWHELTGLRFVYAVWACRASEAESAAARTAGALLDRQRRRNAMRLDWLAARAATDHRWPMEAAQRYLGELLRFDVGPRERHAAETFLTMAHRLGFIGPPRLAWAAADEPAAVG